MSTAAAGQLRTITGLAAGITAPVLGAVAGRVGHGRQLLAASALLAIASSRAGSHLRQPRGPPGGDRPAGRDDAVRLLRRLDCRGCALTVDDYGAFGATVGALFLAAAVTLVRRSASQRTSVEHESAPARPPALLPVLYRTRG